MPEMADARKDHCEVAIVGGGNHFLVGDGAAGLDGGGCARFGRRDESFGNGKASLATSSKPSSRQILDFLVNFIEEGLSSVSSPRLLVHFDTSAAPLPFAASLVPVT